MKRQGKRRTDLEQESSVRDISNIKRLLLRILYAGTQQLWGYLDIAVQGTKTGESPEKARMSLDDKST
jgi:hypothetical protein